MPDRPRTYQAEGIVLRRRNLGEADSIFTLFSPAEGKFDAVARGIRKPRSHMRGHLEPLTRVRVLVARGRSIDIFTQAETVASYRRLHEDLESSALALYCCELVDRFATENVAQEEAYDLLVTALDALDSAGPRHVVRHFEVHLLRATGYELQLAACAVCASPLPARDALVSPAAGGLVCDACRVTAGSGRILSVRAIKTLRFAASSSCDEFAALRVDSALAAELEHALADVIRYVLDLEPRTPRYLEQIHALRQ